ncbi:MAG: hypothetical protein ACRD7E_25130 [Bryobacteraceae bacterium]
MGALFITFWLDVPLFAFGDRSLTLAILVDNVANISGASLRKTQAGAANVFRQAGVGTQWSECSFREAELRDPPGCQLPLDVPAIIVKILPETESESWPVPGRTLGFCQGKYVYILLPHVQALAEKRSLSMPLVLGHALAHEIGHALLGAGHTSESIMRSEFRPTDWGLAAKGQLLFTSNDALRLRRQLHRLAAGSSR